MSIKLSRYNGFVLVFCQFQINFITFDVPSVSVMVRKKIQPVCIILDAYSYVSPTINVCTFQAISFSGSVFSMSEKCCSPTTFTQTFPYEAFGVVTTT